MNINTIVEIPEWSQHVFGFNYIKNGIRSKKTDNESLRVRFRVVYGGRGGSKSWEMARRLIVRSCTETIKILCTREFQTNIKTSVHALIVSQIRLMGLDDLFLILHNSIKSKSGSEFIFKGLRVNSGEIRSLEGVDICWMEEAQKTKQDSLTDLIPTIRKENSEIWVSFNPDQTHDPVYQMFLENEVDDAIVKKVNFYDNPWIPKTLSREAERLKKNNPKLYRNVWLGDASQMVSGDYFPESKIAENIIANCTIGESKLCRGWDLAATAVSDANKNPDFTASVKLGEDDKGRIVVVDVTQDRLNPSDVRKRILSIAQSEPSVTIRLPQDPAQAGKDQAQEYKRILSGFSLVVKVNSGSKQSRSNSLSAKWHEGSVYLVKGAWNYEFIRRMNMFPDDRTHDDVVDAANDAFNTLSLHGSKSALFSMF